MKPIYVKSFGSAKLMMIVVAFSLTAVGYGQTPQYTFVGGSTIGNVSPFGTTGNTRKQWIFSPSNFLPAPPAGYITTIYFNTSASPTTSTYTNLLVKMGQTTLNTFVAGPFITAGMDTVFFASTHTVNIISSGPWLPITLQTPFYFNGSSNFLLDVSQAGYTSGITIQQQTVTGKSLYGPAGASTASVQDRLVQFGFNLMPGTNDAGLEGFVNLPDTLCEGVTPVEVTLKNYGPNPLSSIKIGWKVNNVAQPIYNWSGSLAVNATANITIGNYPFAFGNTYSVTAYSSEPNNVPDTINGNDTIVKSQVEIKASPGITLNDTSITICPGDTALIGGTLNGSPPWNILVNDGTTNYPFNNISSSSFSLTVSPSSSTTYTIPSISDATGCVNTSSPAVTITVKTAPPAVITPLSSTACCMGDSVMLMASIGLNFSYQWFKDGVILPGDTNYICAASTGGAYTVEVTSPYGCSTTSFAVNIVVHPLPQVSIGNDTSIAPGASLILDAGAGFTSYLWSTGATTQTITVDSTGHGLGIAIFWVKVADNYGCENTDSIKVNFVHNPGIEESLYNEMIKIFPNPASGIVEIRFTRFPAGGVQIETTGADGRLVARKEFNDAENDQVLLDLHQIPDGMYMIKILCDDSIITRKLVVQH